MQLKESIATPTLGNYSLLREIKKDGYGILYEAKKEGASTPFFLRVIAPHISSNENFIVRFNLLKTILPSVTHKNLIAVEELDQVDNIFFIAKHLPVEDSTLLTTLKNYDPRDSLNRMQSLESLFQGIAEGLTALENFKKSYYKEGIFHDALLPENIYLSFETSLVGNQKIPYPKIDSFCESFLFYGDTPQAPLHLSLANPLFRKEEAAKGSLDKKTSFGLFEKESFFSFQTRWGLPTNNTSVQYSFGALIYHHFSGKLPKGLSPTLQEIDSSLDPIWYEITNRCLSAPYGQGFLHMQEIVDKFQALAKKRKTLSPLIRKLEEITPPPGMAIVAFTDKVILGAPDGPPVEQPLFKGRIKPFFIDIAPITVKEMLKFLPSYRPSSHSKGDDHPATLITWHMAKAYCKWRSEQEGLPPDSYRLPSEYEWEAAARGGHGEQYPWGSNHDPKKMHCGAEDSTGTLPAKSLLPGRFGIYNMLGNVWEWTDSLFQAHPFSKHIEKGYASQLIVVKGGCWVTPLESCRATLRAAFKPTVRRGNIGFRCVRTIDLDLSTLSSNEVDPPKEQ